MKKVLPDVHKHPPKINGITLNRAGVDNVKFPLVVREKDGGKQSVHAAFAMFGSLGSRTKGVNMSRFVEELMENWTNKPLGGKDFKRLLTQLRTRVGTEDIYVSAEFDYFMKKKSPVTKKDGIMSYRCRIIGALYPNKYNFLVEVNVPVSSYCPCSREMCLTDIKKGIGMGAHNQRGLVTIQAKTRPAYPGVWIEDLIKAAEESASCDVYPLLKRPDEKFVTEKGYSNAKFVEDIARETIYRVREIHKMNWVRVRVRNFESIHPHDAVAYCEQTRRGKRWWRSDRGFYG